MGYWGRPSVVTGHQLHLVLNERIQVSLGRSYHGVACLVRMLYMGVHQAARLVQVVVVAAG